MVEILEDNDTERRLMVNIPQDLSNDDFSRYLIDRMHQLEERNHLIREQNHKIEAE